MNLRGKDMGRVSGRGKWCKCTNHILSFKNKWIKFLPRYESFNLKGTLMLIKETWINPKIYIKGYFYNQQSKMINQVEVTLAVTSSCQGQSIIISVLREAVSHKWHYGEPTFKKRTQRQSWVGLVENGVYIWEELGAWVWSKHIAWNSQRAKKKIIKNSLQAFNLWNKNLEQIIQNLSVNIYVRQI